VCSTILATKGHCCMRHARIQQECNSSTYRQRTRFTVGYSHDHGQKGVHTPTPNAKQPCMQLCIASAHTHTLTSDHIASYSLCMQPPAPQPPPAPAPAGAKNVLLFVVDDLRPQLGAYGQDFMITPNIDKLASEGVVFNRAYVQCVTTRLAIASHLIRYIDAIRIAPHPLHAILVNCGQRTRISYVSFR
jgi:hypothetical protein